LAWPHSPKRGSVAYCTAPSATRCTASLKASSSRTRCSSVTSGSSSESKSTKRSVGVIVRLRFCQGCVSSLCMVVYTLPVVLSTPSLPSSTDDVRRGDGQDGSARRERDGLRCGSRRQPQQHLSRSHDHREPQATAARVAFCGTPHRL